MNIASNKEIMEKLDLVGFEIDPNKLKYSRPVAEGRGTRRDQMMVLGTPPVSAVATHASV